MPSRWAPTSFIQSLIRSTNLLALSISMVAIFLPSNAASGTPCHLLEHRSDGERVRRPPLLHLLGVFVSGAERLLHRRRFSELIDIAVEHRRGVRGRNGCVQIFEHVI